MKTKSYTFSADEMLVIRDAVTEEYVRLRDHMAKQGANASTRLARNVALLLALKEQFQTDCGKT